MARSKPDPLDAITEELVEIAAHAVNQAGAVAVKKLCSQPLTRRAQLMLFEALERRGFERTPKVVRVALEKQLDRVIATEGRAALSGLRKRLAGCASEAEAKRTAVSLASAGRAVWVVSETSEALVSPSAPVLSRDELTSFADLVARATKLSKRLKSGKGQPPRTLERSVLQELMGTAVPSSPPPATPDAMRTILSELATAKESVFVPELTRRLASRMTSAAVKEALVAAARAGRVELRPESGIGLLSQEDRELCPLARDGTPLSYARLSD